MITFPRRIDLIRTLPRDAKLVEVGCHRGYFAIEILNHARNIGQLICVDRWKKAESYVDPLSDDDHEANFKAAQQHCRGHLPGGRIRFIRGDSLDVAANDQTIPPLDGVFVDADHSFEACYADLVAWSKRLKPSGVMLGHDFTETHPNAIEWKFGVVRAVHKFCADFDWELCALTNEDFPSYLLRRKEWRGAEL